MKGVTSKQTGMGILSPAQTLATVLAVMVLGGVFCTMWVLGASFWIMLLVLAVLGSGLGFAAFIFIFNNERFERSIMWLKYFVRALRGKTATHQLSVDMKTVKKYVPIEQIHGGGLIEYIDPKNQYGVMYLYDPAKDQKDTPAQNNDRIERLVNSFDSDQWVSFHFSHTKDTSTTVEDAMLDRMNHPSATPEEVEHLFSMYDHITTRSEDRVRTKFLMSIRLGTFKNAEIARQAYMSTMPGILGTMHEAGIYANLLVTEEEIVRELAHFATLEGL